MATGVADRWVRVGSLRGCRRLRLEHDPRGDSAGLDVGYGLVDLVERSRFADHACLAGRVKLEHLAQVFSCPDDRAHDRDPVEHGFEDRERDLIVRGQRDENELPAATERPIRLLERAWRDGKRDRLIDAAEPLDRLDRVFLLGVDGELGAESRASSSFSSITSTATASPPAIAAYWIARCPRPPTPNTATKSTSGCPRL